MRRSGGLGVLLAAGAVLVAVGSPSAPAPAPETASAAGPDTAWVAAAPGYRWDFPRDHWAHPAYRSEWWYFTGHLRVRGEAEPRFGYQFTLFRVGLARERPPFDSAWTARALVMGHAALTDLRAGTHGFSDVLVRAIPLLGGFGTYPDSTIAWCRAPAGTDDRWTLVRNDQGFDLHAADRERGFGLTLRTVPRKPLVFEGPGGLSRKGTAPGAASLYTSFTRLGTAGRLVVDGDTLEVTGTSWMDQEFGSNQLGKNEVGWDWFSLQLSDDRDVMLYLIRDRDGRVTFGHGTIVDSKGAVRYLEPHDWTVEATGTWKSPVTGAVYPSGWRLEIPSEELRLRVEPLLQDQEDVARRSGNLFYWEGAVRVVGREEGPAGRGYVELTGYGEDNRPPL